MAIVIGDLIEAQHYNEIALEINRLFSDNTVSLAYETSNLVVDEVLASAQGAGYMTSMAPAPNDGDFLVVTVNNITLKTSEFSVNYGAATITINIPLAASDFLKVFNRQEHRFGQGQQASVYPITGGELIRADETTLQAYIESNTNNLVDKINIIEDRISGPSELTRFSQGKVIEATDKTDIQDAIAADILTGDNYWRNDIATVQSNADSFTRTFNWDNILIGEFRFSWDSYNEMRYFFNTGCQLRNRVDMTGDENNQGYFNWNQVCADMGELILDYDTASQTGINGTSEGIGAYELTSIYQVVFTSASPSAPKNSDGLYEEYDEYANFGLLRLVWEARILQDVPSAGNVSIEIRVTLDDNDLNDTTIGTVSMFAGYKTADDVIDNSAVFSITDYIPATDGFNNFTSVTTQAISNITQANPGVVTVPDTGIMFQSDIVTLDNVVGMTAVNGQQYSINILNATQFEIAVDTTSFDAYVSGGDVTHATEDR